MIAIDEKVFFSFLCKIFPITVIEKRSLDYTLETLWDNIVVTNNVRKT